MFGYTAKPDQRVACALCKQIGKDYSQLQRFGLSNDVSLITHLLLSLSDRSIDTFTIGKCFSKETNDLLSEKILSFTAAVNSWMLSVKWNDTVQDSALLSNSFRNSATESGDAINRLTLFGADKQFLLQQLHLQHKYEIENIFDPHKAAEPTARVTGHLLKTAAHLINKPELEEDLFEVGRNLGKLIYLEDARRDIKSDKKTGNYNPFLSSNASVQEAQQVVNWVKSDLRKSLYLLPSEEMHSFFTQYNSVDLFQNQPTSCRTTVKRFNRAFAVNMGKIRASEYYPLTDHRFKYALALAVFTLLYFTAPDVMAQYGDSTNDKCLEGFTAVSSVIFGVMCMIPICIILIPVLKFLDELTNMMCECCCQIFCCVSGR